MPSKFELSLLVRPQNKLHEAVIEKINRCDFQKRKPKK